MRLPFFWSCDEGLKIMTHASLLEDYIIETIFVIFNIIIKEAEKGQALLWIYDFTFEDLVWNLSEFEKHDRRDVDRRIFSEQLLGNKLWCYKLAHLYRPFRCIIYDLLNSKQLWEQKCAYTREWVTHCINSDKMDYLGRDEWLFERLTKVLEIQ